MPSPARGRPRSRTPSSPPCFPDGAGRFRAGSMCFGPTARSFRRRTRLLPLLEREVVREVRHVPGRRLAAEPLVEEVEVDVVIERHLVPGGPVARVREDDEPGRNAHLAKGGVVLEALRVGHAVILLARE